MQNCHECQHYTSSQTGPHEWRAGCGLGIVDFLNAEHCPSYQPSPPKDDDDDDRWPFSAAASAPRPPQAPDAAAEAKGALALAHWGYVRNVLIAHGETQDVIAKCGFHYRTAFEHGFKHGLEAAAEARRA